MDCTNVEIPGCEQVELVCGDGPCACGCADNNTGGDGVITTGGTVGAASETTSADGGSESGTTGPVGATTGAATDSTAGSSSTGSDTMGSGTTGSPLGDCVSVDVWDSCAAYCVAVMESCTPGGCDGATVHYYDNGADCDGQVNADVSDQACEDPLQTSGGVSFARCCCQ